MNRVCSSCWPVAEAGEDLYAAAGIRVRADESEIPVVGAMSCRLLGRSLGRAVGSPVAPSNDQSLRRSVGRSVGWTDERMVGQSRAALASSCSASELFGNKQCNGSRREKANR